MTNLEGIFSIRLVVVDFYMEKPRHSLDQCYSEFRGCEIKKVPIVRIFGSHSNGQKACMHVHGVFPYFYIPYNKKDFESLNKAIYQIAINLDKAINVSLGQGSANAQHVFKIQLVKGIPFYGYHRADHQFLKIYMFNPRFVRRAANLLQNGAILGKNFHPHESHVPYILQFMIDYNLYGMSFLHVPTEVVKFRRNNDEDVIPFAGLLAAQILHSTVAKKQSCSALEVDIGSSFILNRFQLVAKSKTLHSNPGIEAIWNDERLRREKLIAKSTEDVEKCNEVPALEIPATQERPNVLPTESEIFYRTALLSKLMALETSLSGSGSLADQTIDSTLTQTNLANSVLNVTAVNAKEERRTFNLKKVLGNAVYPQECTQDDKLVDASVVENHLSNNSIFQASFSGDRQKKNDAPAENNEDDSIFLEDTIIDEELIMSLTQSHQNIALDASLRPEDLELLDVLQQLEESNAECENQIDLDSSLAPLSQQHKQFDRSPELLDKAATNQPITDNDSADEENDAVGMEMHDFSVALDDIDELLLKLTPSQLNTERKEKLAQLDGTEDLLRTPTKGVRTRKMAMQRKKASPRTPKTPADKAATSLTRSPRTPKSDVASKYAPLPLVFTSKSERKSLTTAAVGITPVSRLDLDAPSTSKISLRKKLALTEMRRKSISAANEVAVTKESAETVTKSTKNPPRRSRNTKDLDKTHITCALTPRRKSTRILKVYSTENSKIPDVIETANDLEPKKSKVTTAMKSETKISTRKSARHARATTSEVEEASTSKSSKKESLEDSILQTENVKEAVAIKKDDSGTSEILDRDERLALETSDSTEGNEENAEEIPKATETTIAKSAAEDDEEISASDNEIDKSMEYSYTTPKLKRLRKSLLSTAMQKRRRKLQEGSSLDSPRCSSLPAITSTTSKTANNFDIEDDDVSDDCDTNMLSFYEKSFTIDSPAIFSNTNSPALGAQTKTPNSFNSACKTPAPQISLPQLTHSATSSAANIVVVTPMDLPPSYEEALTGCRKFDIHEFDFQKPYYSNPDDITKQKEIGFTVLQIPGNKLNDCKEFQSILGAEVKGLAHWRRRKLLNIGGPEMLNRYRNAQRIREYLASEKRVAIAPQMEAPTRHAAKIWLKARELLNGKEARSETHGNEDSPIKVRRQKVAMMLNEAGSDGGEGDEDANCSALSLTLTPLTPASTLQSSKRAIENVTPLTTNVGAEALASARLTARKRRRFQRSKLSLNAKLKAAIEAQNCSPEVRQNLGSEDILQLAGSSSNELKPNQENSQNSHTDDSTSVSSQTVLAELERSSFVRNLQSGNLAQHEVSFGLSNATLNNTFGFKVNLENLQEAKSDVEYNYLTIITLEVFVPTRGDLYPNPEYDEIRCMFYAIENSIPTAGEQDAPTNKLPNKAAGYIIVNESNDILKEGNIHGLDADIEFKVVQTEVEAFETLLDLCSRWDADIYAGYEIETASWGYVIERAKHLCLNIAPLLSRVPTQKVREYVDEDRETFTDLDIEMKLCGRILLDVWRLMRSEIALTSYTFENVMYHILHKRGPCHSFRELTGWFASPCTRWIVLEYYLERVRGTLALLDQLDLIGRTSEMAKLIGIQFYEVLSRGSQFRVESMMLRIAKPKNLVPLSPSVQQRAHMRAPEYLALIMEPQSRFYADPMIVLDFQSLYPSMIIAYNYCFSTCLGRVEHLGQSTPFEFAASQLRVSPTMLRHLLDNDLITISPCGVVFVKATVREGILPRMLTEILDTRQMVKQSMKLHKSNSALQRILHSRQLGLKLMANVTYGYTAANFSGRMPAVEVGDSVVSKGRETLERAIKMVEANDKWNVKVVYGDTDSMFVLAAGRNREQAFKIGEEIAEAVTKANPHPVKLKLEKVYQPCVLQTKKRYVGYMYETADQAEPVYEAKGIETVRRDGCPAVAKMLEKVLRILFESADVSQVKQYICRQFTKLLSGRANLQDLIFAKEFRGLNGYKPTACVPALELTRKWLQSDPRHIPRRGERVPFIIINGPPGVPLIRLVRSPHEVLADEGLKINAIYYITKAIIPPLNRCLLLIGADVNEWFANLPRKLLLTPALSAANDLITMPSVNQSKKSTISQYFSTTNCIVDCGRQTKQGICLECSRDPMKTYVMIHTKIAKIERAFQLTQQICQACCGRIGDISCNSLDCPVLYVMEVKRRDLKQIEHFRNLLEERF